MEKSNLKYLLALSKIDGLGAKRINHLIENFSSSRDVWYASINELKKVEGIGAMLAEKISASRSKIEPEKELDLLEKSGIEAIVPGDDIYPRELEEIYSPPAVLFCKGRLDLLKFPKLGIVGTRKPSRYGCEVLKDFLPPLCNEGIVIVSGFARGIDGMAHKLTLKNQGFTIAVLGGGLDRIYPPEHGELYKGVSKEGLLISEYPPGTPPTPGNFPARNRIISALSKAILIIEAPRKSGTMITAEYALEQNKEVLVVPGNINSPKSKGCNELLSQGAKPVLKVEDILEEYELYDFDTAKEKDKGEKEGGVGTLSTLASKTLELIPFYPYKVHLEELLLESGLQYELFVQEILELELNGFAVKQTGGYISRIK